MAYDIGPRITLKGEKEFNQQLIKINNSLKEYGSELKAVSSQFDDNANSQEALIAKNKVLEKQYETQQQKLKLFQGQLEKQKSLLSEQEAEIKNLTAQYGENSKEVNKAQSAYRNTEANISKLSTSINETTAFSNKLSNEIRTNNSYLDEMAEGSRDAATGLSKLGDEAKNAENDTKNLGDTIKGAFATSELSDAASAIAENIRGIVDESKEHLKIMSALEASSQLAGYTAEQTAETYKILYGVLADDQTAATTTANLQALGLSQEELTRLTYGTIGAWTKYGDSIPIDGLAEAVNETVKTGTVTGTFADVLNWAGTSEDDFNTKLQATTDQSKRANMILQELADQGLIASAEAYRDNNKALIENNEAQAEYQEALSDLSETLMPVFTSITEAITELIEIFNSLPAPVQAVIGVILGIITILTILSPAIMAVSSLFSIFGASAGVAAGGAAAAGTAASGSAVGFGLLNMSLLPVIATILAVVAVVAAVILIFKNWDEIVKWFQDQFANFGAAISDYVDDIGSFFHNMSMEYLNGFLIQSMDLRAGAVRCITR